MSQNTLVEIFSEFPNFYKVMKIVDKVIIRNAKDTMPLEKNQVHQFLKSYFPGDIVKYARNTTFTNKEFIHESCYFIQALGEKHLDLIVLYMIIEHLKSFKPEIHSFLKESVSLCLENYHDFETAVPEYTGRFKIKLDHLYTRFDEKPSFDKLSYLSETSSSSSSSSSEELKTPKNRVTALTPNAPKRLKHTKEIVSKKLIYDTEDSDSS